MPNLNQPTGASSTHHTIQPLIAHLSDLTIAIAIATDQVISLPEFPDHPSHPELELSRAGILLTFVNAMHTIRNVWLDLHHAQLLSLNDQLALHDAISALITQFHNLTDDNAAALSIEAEPPSHPPT